ncbi:MAG: hypothetical protein ACRDNZ_11285 [Streptosporangiaceae bacterium]
MLAFLRRWAWMRLSSRSAAAEVHLREDHIGIYEADMAWRSISSNRTLLEGALGL